MSYGRNFDFRVLPKNSARHGRFVVSSTALSGSGAGGGSAAPVAGLIPIGAPVIANLAAGKDAQGRQILQLATASNVSSFDDFSNSTSLAVPGMAGIAVYEYGPAAFAGDDPYLTTYSDKGLVPLGASCQVISGDPACKVVFTNFAAQQFLGIRSYPARTMVNGLGATPTVAVGDFLIPGLGDDVDGYWQSTANAEGAWLVITGIDTVRLQVEAQMLF